MIKIVIFDSGYGGENFADQLETELPTAEIIRVIDWRNADDILESSKRARFRAEKALLPFIGKVDLIIFANYLLSATSLKYFCKKYKNQKFIGFTLKPKRAISEKPILVLTTKAVARSLPYFNIAHRSNTRTVCLDRWPGLIDDGELSKSNFEKDLEFAINKIKKFVPKQIFLGCSQFTELTPEFRKFFGHNVRIIDSFNDAINDTYKALNIRGRSGKKSNL